MYAITGITGKVGGALAKNLLAEGQPVRAVIRDANKGRAWAELGCEVSLADMEDATALTSAFTGATGVFILPPSEFDPEPGYPEAQRVIDSVVSALTGAKPASVLCLSTIGADAERDNLLSQRTMMEEALMKLGLPLTILRAGWFIENTVWDAPSACGAGVIHSFLQPTDQAFAMVATADVGRVAADLMRGTWIGTRIVELEGPRRVSPDDLALAFGRALGKAVRVETVPRDGWETLFRAQGMKNPAPRIAMLDGFNQGWIAFQDGGRGAIKGRIDADAVISAFVAEQMR
jgi:uncharacterized protein YbjT (DUF2867 family)